MATPKQTKIDPYYVDIYKQVEQLKKDVDLLKGKEITTSDLPMSSLKKNLEQTWNADGNVVLAKGSVKAGSIGMLPGCKIAKTGTQTYTNGSATNIITFDADSGSPITGVTGFDTADMFNSAISTSRIYCRQAGWYTIHAGLCNLITIAVSTQNSSLEIWYNNTNRLAMTNRYYYSAITYNEWWTMSTTGYFRVGDFIDLRYFYEGTSASRNTNFPAFLSMCWHSSMPGA